MPPTDYKPGKIGYVTTALYQDKNIGIDGKIYQFLDARVERVKQDNPQLGDEVEYKISASKQLTEKGKISFFAIKKRAGAPVEVPAQPAPAEKTDTPHEIQDIQAEYVGKDQGRVILKDSVGEQQTYRADIDVIKMLAKADGPVQPNKKYKFHLVKQGEEWVMTKIGPFDESFGEKPFHTGKEILKENLDQKKAEQTQADAALAQINKENEQGDQRMKENAEELKKMVDEKKAIAAQQPVTTVQPPKEPDKVAQTEAVTVPDAILPTTGGVEIGIHVNLGNYSSFDLKVTGINGEHARQLLAQESSPTIALVKGIIKDASKGY